MMNELKPKQEEGMELNLRRKKMLGNNGDQEIPQLPKTAIVAKPRSDSVMKAVDTAFAELAQLRHDRDEAIARRDAALDMCEKAKDFIRRQDQEIADLKSRNVVNQIERDEAVAKHAKLQGLFVAMQAQLRAFEIPVTPIINERISPDAESTDGSVTIPFADLKIGL